MAYYSVCENCGGTLDPGEKCTCEKDQQIAEVEYQKNFSNEKGGQIKLIM